MTTMGDLSPRKLDIIILGGGIAGLTTALALTKFAPRDAVPNIAYVLTCIACLEISGSTITTSYDVKHLSVYPIPRSADLRVRVQGLSRGV